jgi:hypothetical protein
MNTLELKLKRVALKETYTIGKLYVDGVYFSDTLEDKVRDYNKDGDLEDAGETKVYGETAVPYGRYKIILNLSPRFKRILPRLMGVKHFDGILIHPGNTAKDTHGCILVGVNNQVGRVNNSKETFDRLFELLQQANEQGKTIYITIE